MATAHEELARLTAVQLLWLRAMRLKLIVQDWKFYDYLEAITGGDDFVYALPNPPDINYSGPLRRIYAERDKIFYRCIGHCYRHGCQKHGAITNRLTDWILWMNHSSDFTEVRNSWASHTQD